MCGRLRVGKDFLHVPGLVGAAMCSAYNCGSHGPLAIMPSADQVPVNNTHSITMRWHKWVVLIAGSTGSALRAVRPPNLHITPVAQRDLVYRASAAGFRYRSPLAIMAQAIRAILLASAMAATLVGRRPSNAVSHGRCPVPWILA